MSTTRSQLYRFARDLGNVEAIEHGYARGGLSGGAEGAATAPSPAELSTGMATARSITSSGPSVWDREDGESTNHLRCVSPVSSPRGRPELTMTSPGEPGLAPGREPMGR